MVAFCCARETGFSWVWVLVTGSVVDRLVSLEREWPFALDVAQERKRSIYESEFGGVSFIDRAWDTSGRSCRGRKSVLRRAACRYERRVG